MVVTGIGMVSPLGNDIEISWASLIAGESGAADITHFDASEFPVHFAAELKDFVPTDWMEHKQARRMDRFAQMIVAASRQAESDSGIDIAKEPDRVGASIATGIGGLGAFQDCFQALIDRGPDRVNPFSITAIIPNMGAGWVSMELGTQRPALLPVHRVRGFEHGDRRRRGRDPARTRRRDDLRRHRGAGSRASVSPASARCAPSRAATTTRKAHPARSTPAATAS